MGRALLLASILACVAACGFPSTPAPSVTEAHAATSPPAPPAPIPAVVAPTTPVAAPPPPILVGAVRGSGPYASLCDGLPHVDFRMFGDELACDDESPPNEHERLVAPESPFDEASLVWVPQLAPFHGEAGVLVLAVRNEHDWYLSVLDANEGDEVGGDPTPALRVENLRVEHSGAEPRLTYRSTCALPGSETRLVSCALRERRFACASIPIAQTGPQGWSATPLLAAGDEIRLSDLQGTPPEALEVARPRRLLFDDAALTPARSLSNRCHRLRGSGDLEGAEESCSAGLAASPTHEEEGALLYDVGRIAEARGDTVAAQAAYTRSLEVRPRSAVVRARLEGLETAE